MLGRAVTWPIRAGVRKLMSWKLADLRRYECSLVALSRKSEKISVDRLEALMGMLKRVREQIAMLERQMGRAA